MDILSYHKAKNAHDRLDEILITSEAYGVEWNTTLSS